MEAFAAASLPNYRGQLLPRRRSSSPVPFLLHPSKQRQQKNRTLVPQPTATPPMGKGKKEVRGTAHNANNRCASPRNLAAPRRWRQKWLDANNSCFSAPHALFRQVAFNQGKFYRRKKELTDDQLNEIQDSFDLFVKDDKDAGDIPKIDAEDLLVVMRALGHEPQPSELKKLVQEVDPDNTGQLDFDGYLNIILNKMAERPSELDLQKAFRLFDPAGKRRINFDDLKRIAGQIGEDIEDGELQDMINEADHSGTGEINQEDFVKIVTSCKQSKPLPNPPCLQPSSPHRSSNARPSKHDFSTDAKHYDGDR